MDPTVSVGNCRRRIVPNGDWNRKSANVPQGSSGGISFLEAFTNLQRGTFQLLFRKKFGDEGSRERKGTIGLSFKG